MRQLRQILVSISACFALVAGLHGGEVLSQDTLTTGPTRSGAAAQQMNRIRNNAIGRGYTIADMQRLSTNSVQGLRASNLTGTTLTGQVLRPVGVTAADNRSSFQPLSAPSRSYGGAAATSASAPTTKPFQNISRGPTVSPYLLLFNDGLGDEPGLNYQTLVRPMLRQQQVNRDVNRQQQQINQQLAALAGRNAFQAQGSQQLQATGHAAVFNNTLNFFPGRARR